MNYLSARFERSKASTFAVGASLICVCLLGSLPVDAQVTDSLRGSGSEPPSRLLSAQEGRLIADSAQELNESANGILDCSHVVHQIYLHAGFEYPYASSFDIYAGNENFHRVKIPQAGDLIVWPGHLGIVVDPEEHSFYSLVSTGLEIQNYEGPYWKSRGRPRFYRYRIAGAGILNGGAGTPTTAQVLDTGKQPKAMPVAAERSPAESSAPNRPLKTVSERTPTLKGPSDSAVPVNVLEVPPSIIITTGNKSPARDEVAEAISELSSASGSVLRTDDPSKLPLPVLIVERFSVERVEIKRDRGWARLQIDSRILIAGGEAHVKRQRENVRWELRRTESGWEAIAPSDRTYVPQDVAVKNLAAQLAHLTVNDGAATHQETLLRQESRLANLLSALLEEK
jgi:hypothetical protein